MPYIGFSVLGPLSHVSSRIVQPQSRRSAADSDRHARCGRCQSGGARESDGWTSNVIAPLRARAAALSLRLSLGVAKQPMSGQRQPTRLICEVEMCEGFARKNDDGRNADRRLANRRLQPLGHLTAARKISINEIATYAPAECQLDCPQNGPYQLSESARNATLQSVRSADPNAAVLFDDSDAGNCLTHAAFVRA